MTDDLDDHLVHAADEQRAVPVELEHFVALARHVLTGEGVDRDAEVGLVFVDLDTIADYNERFLDRAEPTDVLAFPIDDDVAVSGRNPDRASRGPGSAPEPDEIPTLLGDVMVCPAFAQRSADARSAPVVDEMELLVVHGLLHLLGHDHAEPDETERMQTREHVLLATFRASDGARP